MPRIDIRGRIVSNSQKWIYDYLEMDATCPRDVKNVIDTLKDGDELEVYINSPGGNVVDGSEIYTLLMSTKKSCNLKIYITGYACSAASVIAMAGYCEMAPTALLMIHCAATSASGNRASLAHAVEMLQTVDQAICAAYMNKTGMSQQDALALMKRETWFTAEQAKERRFVDAIMFQNNEQSEEIVLVAGTLRDSPSEKKLLHFKQILAASEPVKSTQQILDIKEKSERRIRALQMAIKPEAI